jgi:hypothetical protein
MANGFPVNISRQAGGPISSSDINALAAAVNESAPAKVTAAGQIPVGIGLNEIAALAAPLASGLLLGSDLGEPTKLKWVGAIDVYTATQTPGPGITLTASDQTIPGLSLDVTIKRANSVIIAFLGGGVQQPTGSGGQTNIDVSMDGIGMRIWLSITAVTSGYLPISGVAFRVIPTTGVKSVFAVARQGTPNSNVAGLGMVVLVV